MVGACGAAAGAIDVPEECNAHGYLKAIRRHQTSARGNNSKCIMFIMAAELKKKWYGARDMAIWHNEQGLRRRRLPPSGAM